MTFIHGTAAIVVPCFNEGKRLDVRQFQEFAESRADIRFVFVNDGSTDDTGKVLERLRDANPQTFELIHLPRNCGKGEAVRQGMLWALATAVNYVGFWDADLATPLEMIDSFRGVLGRRPDIEMVFGTRLRLLGHRICRTGLRGVLGSTFARFASVLLGLRIRDTQCGAKLFRSSPLTQSVFQRPFLSRWIFDVEILGRLVSAQRDLNLRIDQILYELPLDRWEDVAGGSLKGRDLWRAIVDLGAIYWRWLRPGAEALTVDLSPWTLDATGRRDMGEPENDQTRRRSAA